MNYKFFLILYESGNVKKRRQLKKMTKIYEKA